MKYNKISKNSIKLIVLHQSSVIDEKNRRVIHRIDWKLSYDPILMDFIGDTSDDYRIMGSTKGVAICHPKDEFNPELGKKLARAMAESNAYRNASKRLLKRIMYIHKIVRELSDQCVDFAFKSDNIQIHNKEYQDNLVK